MIAARERAINYVVVLAFALYAVVPLIGVVFLSLRPHGSTDTGFSVPLQPAFDNYLRAWDVGQFGSSIGNSVAVAFAVVAMSVAVSVLAGYAFGTMSFRGRTTLFYFFLAGLTLPTELTIIPLYYGLRSVGLTDTYVALILPQVASVLAFGTFWMRAYFLATPAALIEAARVDGAGTWVILWRVLLPNARAALTTLVVLVFISTWNEFLIPLVMSSRQSLRTVPLALSFFKTKYETDQALTAAGAVIIAVPVVLVYFVLQRHFVQGVVSGAVKE
jgi:raffinose/stachyose/melibiose transport system permease protein